MSKYEGKPRVKSGRNRTQSSSPTVLKIASTSQKVTERRGRSVSSSAAKTGSAPSNNCATISRTSSSATVSQLADNIEKATQKSPSSLNRTPGTNYRNTPTSEVVSDELAEETIPNGLLFIPERRTDKTFIYMYDEKEKTSKEIIVPKDIHITLPVLVQYEITEDTIRQVTDAAAQSGTARTEIEPHLSEDQKAAVDPNSRYVTPTPELLCTNEEDEMKNKGARIMKWLLEVQCE